MFESLGFTLWEWLNPEQVAAEYEALGKEAPAPVEFGDVIGAAMEDTRDVVVTGAEEIGAGAQQLASGVQKTSIALAVTAVIAGIVYLSQKRRRK